MTVNYETGEIVEPDHRPSAPIDRIIVGDRARKDYGDLSDLMESIREHGVLQPVGVLPGNRLLFGGRRLEACKRLGMTTIPITRPRTQDDALAMLRAERDENTCRKDMTPEELVDLGLQIEELERPKAAERQAEGQRRGAASTNSERWGIASGPVGPEATKPGDTNRTATAVGEALGISKNHYKRAKHVVQTARGDNAPTPEVQQEAQKALEAMNSGTATVTGAYNKVRKARNGGQDAPAKPEGRGNLARPQPPKFGGNRKKHAAVIDSINVSLSGLAMAADDITEFDPSVTAEEAARLADDLSNSLRSLNRLKKNLTRKATS